MKRILAILALAVAPALVLSSGGASAAITVNPDGSFSVSTDRIAYLYEPNGAIRISQFGVALDGGAKKTVFTFINANPFQPLQPPTEHGRTISIPGASASLETHASPHATMFYKASAASQVTLSLDSGVGAVVLGDHALVWDADILADMAVTNDGTIEKSVDNIMVSLQDGDAMVYRVQGPSGSLGELMASGKLHAEIDITTVNMAVDSDLTSYKEGAYLAVEAISKGRASLSFSGLDADSVAIVDLSDDVYSQVKEKLAVKVDGKSLNRYGDVQDFLKDSDNGFVVSEGSTYAEILLRAGQSSGVLVIETTGLDVLLVVAALASVAVCVVAAFILFRRKSQ